MNNELVTERVDDIAELERIQDECEENFRRAAAYVKQWQRNLAEVCRLRSSASRTFAAVLLCYMVVSLQVCQTVQLRAIREENIRRAEVLQTWNRAVREQLPGLAAAPSSAQPIALLQRQQRGMGVASPLSGAGARTVSFHSHTSGPSEDPRVLRDVINAAAAAGTDLTLPASLLLSAPSSSGCFLSHRRMAFHCCASSLVCPMQLRARAGQVVQHRLPN
jgi:hypothetical protein